MLFNSPANDYNKINTNSLCQGSFIKAPSFLGCLTEVCCNDYK